jgi:hypothetical protein
MLPEAFIVHQITHRLRFKVQHHRGDHKAMARLAGEMAGYRKTVTVKTGVATGSVLLTGKAIDADALRNFGRSRKLFDLKLSPGLPASPLTKVIAGRMKGLDNGVRQLTYGMWDLPATLFMSLLLVAVVEIMRGNFRMPPWYTAFWYAFGLFTKSMLDRTDSTSSNDPADAERLSGTVD